LVNEGCLVQSNIANDQTSSLNAPHLTLSRMKLCRYSFRKSSYNKQALYLHQYSWQAVPVRLFLCQDGRHS
ncbi:hypothetical protein BaRGS_00022981, partial [Batillaria attramentaria]